MTNKRILIVDCDGVLLDWFKEFDAKMRSRGYKCEDPPVYNLAECYNTTDKDITRMVTAFNKHTDVNTIMAGAKEALQDFSQRGWQIHCVSCYSNKNKEAKRRKQHLSGLFGNVFADIHILPLGGSKKDYLSQFKGAHIIYVDDDPGHAKEACELGIKTYLMAQPYNVNESADALIAGATRITALSQIQDGEL